MEREGRVGWRSVRVCGWVLAMHASWLALQQGAGITRQTMQHPAFPALPQTHRVACHAANSSRPSVAITDRRWKSTVAGEAYSRLVTT